MKAIFSRLSQMLKRDNLEQKARRRIRISEIPSRLYAIGDVHGRADLQKQLEEKIIAESLSDTGLKIIIYLGDLVDRGPQSARVLDQCLTTLPDDFIRICLCGNHDQALLDFYNRPSMKAEWFNFGGKETLASYGLDLDYILRMKLHKDEFIALVRQTIPPEHIAFLEALPIALSTPYAHFAHAGMRPGRDMEKQTDEDLMWIRGDFLIDKAASDRLIVHGHTPSNKPLIGPDRIGVDTGAYMGGGLTAIRFVAKDYSFLSVR